MNGFWVAAVICVGSASVVASSAFEKRSFVPQVAFHCGYRNRFLSRSGEWVTDGDANAVCLTGKLDILKYCKRSYPDLTITNIVESSHNYQIDDRCKVEGSPCKWSFWVKPYRCLVGDFESEALLVPKGCNFGHVDDRSMCEDFPHWNRTAHKECASRKDPAGTGASMSLRSFAILEPCGLDMFSGVEYVCCGKEATQKKKATDELTSHVKASIKQTATTTVKTIPDKSSDWWDEAEEDSDDDDDSYSESESEDMDYEDDSESEDYDDEDEDDDYDDGKSSSNERMLEEDEKAAANDEMTDPYLRLADPDNEHDRYKAAIKRLQQKHRQKQAKIMSEWADLETDYQRIKSKDPKQADGFRKKMTERFQQTVSALEEQTRNQRKQFDTVHQQRVRAALNEKKRENIKVYRDAMSQPSPKSHAILKALEAYVRTEEKDRLHNINRYRHLLRSDPDEARTFRPDLLKRLSDIDLRINATVDMLTRVPDLLPKIKPVALEFWQTYRVENTPEFIDEPMVWIGTQKNNVAVLDKLVQEAKDALHKKSTADASASTLSELWKHAETVEEKFEHNLELKKKEQSKPVVAVEPPQVKPVDDPKNTPLSKYVNDMLAQERAENAIKAEVEKEFSAHAMKDVHGHSSSVKEEVVSSHAGSGITAGVVIGGIACLMSVIIGMIVWRVKTSARGQGFIEVDPCTPEERHVATMQVNGYENPTYSYFEKP